MEDKDIMRVDMSSLVNKVEMVDNHDMREIKNLASEILIKYLKGILAYKESKVLWLIFAINKTKE